MHSISTLLVVVALAAEAPPQRPNIILCMADDQGWGDMAYNGHQSVKTPVFDEMARTALRLDRFYAAAPVCSPTRGSVLTGRTPNRYGVYSWGHSLRPQEVTIAEVLRDAGYATGHFGKWHLGSVLVDSPLSPGANGFDEWLSAPNFFELNPWLSAKGKATQYQGESSEIVVDAALEFIKAQQAAGRPFLAVVWFGSPHAPHLGTDQDVALYSDQPKAQQHFLAEITAMDGAMGKLRTGLRDLKIADNTLLWYTSDNGAIPQGSTGGLRGRKGQIYDGGLRVPCLIEWPARIRSPRQSAVTAGTVDIYPTLIELTGARPKHQPTLDGQSLVPLFSDAMTARTKPLGFWDARIAGFGTPSDRILQFVAERQKSGEPITKYHAAHGLEPAPLAWDQPAGRFPGHSAWIDGDWKLHRIEAKDGGKVRFELYNLATDSKETTDQSGQEPERLAKMQADLESWLRSVAGSLRGDDYKAIGSKPNVGCLDNPTRVGRLAITSPGVYENILVDGQWSDSTLVKIVADNVTLRHCEIHSGKHNAVVIAGKNVVIEACRVHHVLAGTFEDQRDAHGITGQPEKLVIRNCEIGMVSGDAVQFDPGRGPWDDVLIENCTLWTGPLESDAAGFKRGQRPGENGVDTKQQTSNPRSRVTIRNCLFHGWKQPGQVSNMAALNLKSHVECNIENCVFRDNEICLRLRGGDGDYGGALVTVDRCAVYDSEVAVRIEDRIRDLKIRGLGVGSGVAKKLDFAGGGAGPGFEFAGEFEPPALVEVLQRGVPAP